MAANVPSQAAWATAMPSTCMATTRRLRRSERPGGRSVDPTAHVRHRIVASLRQHLSRSTASLTTLHEPWIPDAGGFGAGRVDLADTGDVLTGTRGGPATPRQVSGAAKP